MFLVSSFLFSLFFLVHFILICPQMLSDNYITYPLRLLMFYWESNAPELSFMIASMLWFMLWRAFHLLVFIYATSSGLTLDEIYHAHQYPYLYSESHTIRGKYNYMNPSNKGFFRNWIVFFKQNWTPKPILEDI